MNIFTFYPMTFLKLVCFFILFFFLSDKTIVKASYFNELKINFKQQALTSQVTFSCSSCHSSDSHQWLNQFAIDYVKLIKNHPTDELKWKKFFNLDSNHNGITNYLDLAAGSNPGKRTN